MNLQLIEHQNLDPDGNLQVHHIFYTIQGEGPYAGHPAVFIRLAGCNLQCPNCDTEYTSQRTTMTPKAIYDAARVLVPEEIWNGCGVPLVVITGGEPFRQNLGPTVQELAGFFHVQIETNGTLFLEPQSASNPDGFPYEDESVTIVCSPKTAKINQSLFRHISAFKYILEHGKVSGEDGLPLSSLGCMAAPCRPPDDWRESGLQVFVQPQDNGINTRNSFNRTAAIRSSMDYGYTLCVQLQKIIGLE